MMLNKQQRIVLVNGQLCILGPSPPGFPGFTAHHPFPTAGGVIKAPHPFPAGGVVMMAKPRNTAPVGGGRPGGGNRHSQKKVANLIVPNMMPNGQKDGRILVVQLTNGKWTPPGGYVDRGETPENAAIRESKEESGYEHSPHSLHLDKRLRVTNLKFNVYVFVHDGFNFQAFGHHNRVATFHNRTTRHETKDYGFARLLPNGRWQVENFDGTPKRDQDFRRGIITTLNNYAKYY